MRPPESTGPARVAGRLAAVWFAAACFVFCGPSPVIAQAPLSFAEALTKVRNVQPGGGDHSEVVPAMAVLNNGSKSDILRVLRGFDGAEQPAVNWLRSAVMTLAAKDGELPAPAIENYFNDVTHSAMGRLVAFELLGENDEEWRNEVVMTLLDDPSMPLRELGVAAWINVVNEKEGAERIALCRRLFEKARDLDQVVEVAGMLEEAGESVDVQKQLGYLASWRIVGCFDNRDEGGFDVEQGPETDPSEISESTVYEDYEGNDANWQATFTEDSLGLVDLTEVIGPVKGVSAFGSTTFCVSERQEVEFRIGTPNAHKIWVNGELIMSNEVYHNSNSPDKFSAVATLEPGENLILIKLCQNEQTEPWAQDWQFQLRICDETGKAIEGVCGRF